MSEPSITHEDVDDGEHGEEPVEPILQCTPGHQRQERQEQHTTGGVHHPEENEHGVGHSITGATQTVRVKPSSGNRKVGDEWCTDQDQVEQQGCRVDPFFTAPNLRPERKR